MQFNILLFENFETLDVFGPVEVFGKIPGSEIAFHSLAGGPVANGDGLTVLTRPLSQWIKTGPSALFVPGGPGTRNRVNEPGFIKALADLAAGSDYIMSVCTGSALLARAGVLDGKNATSNKRAFGWVIGNSGAVNWKYQARWVVDGKIYTSSGVSAGLDMAFAFVRQAYGDELAETIAGIIEYTPVESPGDDPFAEDDTFRERYK